VRLKISAVDLVLTEVYTRQAFISFPFERAPPPVFAF
jgi:hypothetical protein